MKSFQNLTFVTGNANKAAYLERNLGVPLLHQAVDVLEIQSLDIAEVATAKARAAYEALGVPVLVDDAGLYFRVFGKLPGILIKWFLAELGHEKICRLLDSFDDRRATAAMAYCLYDGAEAKLFQGEAPGTIAEHPRGDLGFGFDSIFIHEGIDQTRGELSVEEQEHRSPRSQVIKVLAAYLKA